MSTEPAEFAANAAPRDDGPRIVIFLGGLQSHSLERPGDDALRSDFAPLRNRLAAADPALRFVYFSYAAGRRLAAGSEPRAAWRDRSYDDGNEPRYSAARTTDLPLSVHVAGLDWLIGDLLVRFPGARFDLIGFSLGGIVALAWAADAPASGNALGAIHRIVLISSPVGGVTSFGRAASAFGVRHVLHHYRICFGRSLVFRDLRRDSPLTFRLRGVPETIDVASVENSRDYVVNGERIAGQEVLPVWLRTITLGRGVAITSFLPPSDCLVADLGGWERHLRTTHHHILRGESDEIERVRDRIVEAVLVDGPMWRDRQASGLDVELLRRQLA